MHAVRLGDGDVVRQPPRAGPLARRARADIERAAAATLGWAGGGPALLGGDFNVREPAPQASTCSAATASTTSSATASMPRGPARCRSAGGSRIIRPGSFPYCVAGLLGGVVSLRRPPLSGGPHMPRLPSPCSPVSRSAVAPSPAAATTTATPPARPGRAAAGRRHDDRDSRGRRRRGEGHDQGHQVRPRGDHAKVGQKIEWENTDGQVPHNVTATEGADFDSGR